MPPASAAIADKLMAPFAALDFVSHFGFLLSCQGSTGQALAAPLGGLGGRSQWRSSRRQSVSTPDR